MEIRGKNERDHLILKLDEKGGYKDITNQVIYLKEDYKSWYVVFSNKGENKDYNIAWRKIKLSINPIEVEFNRNQVYFNKKRIDNVIKVIQFDDLGYKIFFRDKDPLFVKHVNKNGELLEITFMKTNLFNLGNPIFDYYKALASYASEISMDELSIEKILEKLYRRIENINPNSVLSAYTESSFYSVDFDERKLIFPFPTNASQMKGQVNAFTNNLSVISGPPGTGKTQIILNMIASAVVNNLKVAVISNNNTAIENVYEKLKDLGFEFILAYLGKAENVEKFFSQSDNLSQGLEKISNLKTETNLNVLFLKNQLESLYNDKNDIILLKQQIFELEEEFRHYKENHKFTDYSLNIKKLSSHEDCLKLKYYLSSKEKFGILSRLKLKLFYKLDITKIENIGDFINYLDYKYFEKKLEFLNRELIIKQDRIDKSDLDKLAQNLKESSLNKFIDYLLDKYEGKNFTSFNKDNYKENFDEFVDRYPVTLSTTHSLLRNCSYDFEYDLVIIDEASQSDILTSLLTMNIAKKMVVIGDIKQLPQIDNQEIYEASDYLVEHYNIPKSYQYKDNSLLSSVLSLNGITNTILREHYRCDSRIIQFCNKKFYDNELIVATKTSKEDPLIIVHTVPGNHARKNPNGSGQYNDREAQEIKEIIASLDEKDIGVITPFSAQAEYIKKELQTDYEYVEVNTIHGYQGRQKDIIILSTVVNDLDTDNDNFITNFVTNSKLLNVAISRAVKKLYLVVSDKVYNSSNNTISQFIDYIKYYCSGQNIEEGKVVSIFDSLYGDGHKIYKTNYQTKADSLAEIVMIVTLKKILDSHKDLKVHMHVSLRELINNLNGFNEEEVKYIKHPKTHVDFVLFDRITYKPVLCIEVDGTKYHDYSKKQKLHDEIKSRALELNGIKLLRLKTNGSREVEKIEQALE